MRKPRLKQPLIFELHSASTHLRKVGVKFPTQEPTDISCDRAAFISSLKAILAFLEIMTLEVRSFVFDPIFNSSLGPVVRFPAPYLLRRTLVASHRVISRQRSNRSLSGGIATVAGARSKRGSRGFVCRANSHLRHRPLGFMEGEAALGTSVPSALDSAGGSGRAVQGGTRDILAGSVDENGQYPAIVPRRHDDPTC